jgi:hypothetical protein
MSTFATVVRSAGVVGGALVVLCTSTVLAPPAWADDAHPCWTASYETKISKLNVTQVDYDAEFHWCATAGKVDTFVVDKAYANASGWTHDAGIDVQPFKPGAFDGPSFDVYVNVWGHKNDETASASYNGVTLNLTAGQYRDYYDITLNGDGTITGTKYKYR